MAEQQPTSSMCESVLWTLTWLSKGRGQVGNLLNWMANPEQLYEWSYHCYFQRYVLGTTDVEWGLYRSERPVFPPRTGVCSSL